jgi:flagellar basal body-associated protein FliL
VKNLSLLMVILLFLFAGGALTTMLSGAGSSGLLSPIQQTADPAASTLQAEPWQAEQLFLLIVIVLLIVVGIGVGTAMVMWILHREIAEVKAMPVDSQAKAVGAKRS